MAPSSLQSAHCMWMEMKLLSRLCCTGQCAILPLPHTEPFQHHSPNMAVKMYSEPLKQTNKQKWMWKGAECERMDDGWMDDGEEALTLRSSCVRSFIVAPPWCDQCPEISRNERQRLFHLSLFSLSWFFFTSPTLFPRIPPSSLKRPALFIF